MIELDMNGDVYDVVPDEARFLTEYLFSLQQKLGIPEDLTVHDLSESVWKFIMAIFSSWAVAYPQEHQEWLADMEFDLKYERPVQQAIKGGGFVPIVYPSRFYSLMKIFLPKVELQNKQFIHTLIKRIPQLRSTNYIK